MFRTEVQTSPTGLDLDLSSSIVTIGSCFAQVIGHKLQENKARVLVNPFGTLFNPLSVCKLLRASIARQHEIADNLVQQNGIWYAYDLHSSISSTDRQQLLQLIEQQLETTRQALQQARLLIITLGTAVGYRLQSNGQVVANCHKLPARHFSRELLPSEQLLSEFELTLSDLHQFNPSLKVLVTVSPVRHIKETLEVNSVSKAILRLLCHQLTERFPEEVRYFPAYEIMIDDLRDYRFYGRDMIHPTEVAEDYIWDKFAAAYLSKDFRAFLPEWQKMRRALAHRPFHPASEAHQAFLRATLKQLQELGQKHGIDTSLEQAQIEKQLT